MENKTDNLVFFLGGYDLEMITIKKLLDEKGIPYHDKELSWGAKASDYRNEINNTISSGLIPVLLELNDDMSLSQKKAILVDHHGEKAAESSSTLKQIFQLLKFPPEQWTRWFELVDANDRGHIQALRNIGANKSEILKVRKADRQAQGITEEQEKQGRIAIKNAKIILDDKLTIVELQHSKTAVVTDLLHPALGGQGYENLLIISPNEVNFYGKGNLVMELNDRYSNGWFGGSLPEYGFWGHDRPVPDILNFIKLKVKN